MKRLLSVLTAFFLSAGLYAGNNPDSTLDEALKYVKLMDSVNKALKYETGNVQIKNGIAQLNVPAGFKFLNADQSKYVVEELWGNMPQTNLQGMLFPVNSNPFDDSSYAFIITYEEMGYVKDDDADKIDYDELMTNMKKDEVKENQERTSAGVRQLHTIGWAAKPYYDKTNKVLHWAFELKAEGADHNTLNYNVMILGRKGLLSMNAVAPIYSLDSVKNHIAEVIAIPKFTDGNKYSDFNPDVDNVAAWTIGGLVAGKVLAKVGFLAVIGKFLKFIIIGVVAAGGAIWKFITGRRKKKDEEYVPVAAEQTDQTV